MNDTSGARPAIVTAGLLVIGDEILSGRTKDRNIGYIAEYLTAIGIDLREVRVVADDEAAIVESLNALRGRYTYVFTTGGIGPTHDDITADCVAKAFGVPIDYDPRAVAIMKERYAAMGTDMNEARMRMTRIPKGAELVTNAVSAAPGFWIGNVIVMAGVPSIMQAMLDAVAGKLKTGVVFLHGKAVWAGAFDGGIPAALEAEGALVAEPEMPWSFTRLYGATYDEAMREIDAAVAQLKAHGATRIVVIGHSLGANAAIGYAARRSAVAAVVALAPGHLPETAEMRERTQNAVAEARGMLAAGTGLTTRHAWPDMIQGIPTFAFATPAVYVSMFDPNGPAVIPKNAAAMRPIPLLWVAGSSDPIFARGPDYAYARGARNPKSRYLEVSASHLTTPWVAQTQVVEWLKSL